MPSLKIVKYKPEHFKYILKLNQQVIDMPWSESNLVDTFEDNNILCLVCEIEDIATGFIIIRSVVDEAEILLLAVSPKSQRGGIATILLDSCMDELKNMGVKRLFLEVSDQNIAAVKFYMKNQFVKLGVRANYYTLPNNIKASALVLSKSILFD